MLRYKEDFDAARERQEAWWRRETIGRCCMEVTAPKDGVTRRAVPKPASLEEQWTDMEAVIDRFEAAAEARFYGGEAIPLLMPNLGPNVLSAWLGCPLQFAETTTWVEPIVRRPEDYAALHFDRNGRWWKWMREMTALCARRGKGRFITGMTDLHGGGDALAGLRGTEALCADLVEAPQAVKAAERTVQRTWVEVTEELYGLIAAEGQVGCGGFLGWAPGRSWPLQDDLFALISPKMAREFFIETIAEQARSLDRAMFHLDGPESLPNLDLLLDLPDLDGIQWQPGHAHREMLQWIPLLKRILGRGKCVLVGVAAAEVEPILREVPAHGLKLVTSVASEAEARDLLRRAERWTRD